MLNRKREQKEYRTRKTEAEKKIEKVRAEVEKVLKRLRQIEVEA